jgi:fatty acid desaturase
MRGYLAKANRIGHFSTSHLSNYENMLLNNGLRPAAEYRQFLKAHLPEKAFAPSPRKLIPLALHLLIIGCCYCGIRFSDDWCVWFVCSLVIGHGAACIAFIAHEMSHRAVIGNRSICYVFEVILWGLNFISPTVWRRVHNQTHHAHTNEPKDPDRRFLESEANIFTNYYTRAFYPNNRSLRLNVLVGVHFIPYIVRNTIAAFYPDGVKPTLVPWKPQYTGSQRITICFEIAATAMLQFAIFCFVGGAWQRYLFASPIAIMITSCVVMAYVFTNHFLNPICDSNDPLSSTTSVVVPHCFDVLHCNFSYHTEHHLFPSMNSKYYPAVSQLLNEHYKDRYHRVSFLQAWKRLWCNEVYVPEDRVIQQQAAQNVSRAGFSEISRQP